MLLSGSLMLVMDQHIWFQNGWFPVAWRVHSGRSHKEALGWQIMFHNFCVPYHPLSRAWHWFPAHHKLQLEIIQWLWLIKDEGMNVYLPNKRNLVDKNFPNLWPQRGESQKWDSWWSDFLQFNKHFLNTDHGLLGTHTYCVLVYVISLLRFIYLSGKQNNEGEYLSAIPLPQCPDS